MKRTSQGDFDPAAFLAKVGDGKTVSTFHKSQTVFSQGEAADTVFHIQKGSVKVVDAGGPSQRAEILGAVYVVSVETE